MKRFRVLISPCLLISLVCFIKQAEAQFVMGSATYSQNLNTLGTGSITAVGGNLGSHNATLTGWYFEETGSNQNTTMTADDGSNANGDSYNYGANLGSDRSLGLLQTGTLNSSFGFYFTNNTGFTITRLFVRFVGKQWRLGEAGRLDKLDFQYSANATSLNNGNWFDADALDFIAPVNVGIPGPLNGNDPANQTTAIYIIQNLFIVQGSSFFIKWTDFDATGNDDGLAIDNVDIAFLFNPYSTEHFRTVQSGAWINLNTWESSPDNISWLPATTIPTAHAETIIIRNSHTVSYAAIIGVDELTIANGGVLDIVNGNFLIVDGPGDDVNIQNGGAMHLSIANTPPNFSDASAVLNVSGGGILKVNADGMTDAGIGVNSNNIVYKDQSILETGIGFSTAGVTYFPNVNAATIPVFRTVNFGALTVGANTTTTINGVFEANGTGLFTWENGGNKIFRNGIRGGGNVVADASASTAKFIINGTTAELGGSGNLAVPAIGGLEIGTSSYVTMISNKTVTGNIFLLSDSYVELGNNSLTVTGTIAGGANNSHVITNATGFLKIKNVGITQVDFPVGHSISSYNPVSFSNPGTIIDFDVRIVSGISPSIAFPAYAVNRTWVINTSAVPSTGVITKFQYDAAHCNVGVLPQPQPMELLKNVSLVWNVIATNLSPVGSDPFIVTANSVTSFNTPFSVGRNGGWALPVQLLSFNAVKRNNTSSEILWELGVCCSRNASFEVQRSIDGNSFMRVITVGGSETNRFYKTEDDSLPEGMIYYRLKITDENGKITYSKVIMILNKKTVINSARLYPSIVLSTATLDINAEENKLLDYIITDMNGRVLSKKQLQVLRGNNRTELKLDHLAVGIFTIIISNGSKTIFIGQFARQ
ncbi:MAG: hypothetical protein E6H07_18150 [Bacteroidetes bacterium]|nr:MAG: hypothetical protein E6H07_18150 [Bacteroidota bacterium]